MSVQTQIDRISGAVQSALAALSEKGVEVPAGTKVDGLAALIAAIEAGGGSGGMSSGTITFSENTPVNGYTITHGITSPRLFVIAGVTGTKASGSVHLWARCWNTMFSGVHMSTSSKNATLYIKKDYFDFNSNSINLTSIQGSEYFVSNTQYWWVCYTDEV